MKRLFPLTALLTLAFAALPGCNSEDNPAGAEGDTDAGQSTDGGAGGNTLCVPDATSCRNGRLATCLPEGDGYLVEACPDAQVCFEGACQVLSCAPGARFCAPTAGGAEGVAVCAEDGSGPTGPATACAADTSCVEGVCLARTCAEGERACGEGVALTCAADGLSWDRAPCDANERCVNGACTAGGGFECPPGEVLCGAAGIYTCTEDGGWIETPCDAGSACFEGACVACVRDRDCASADLACVQGECVPAPLAAVPAELPAGQVGRPYIARLQASRGAPPYAWRVTDGALPGGLRLAEDGALSGSPAAAGDFDFEATVTDVEGEQSAADYTMTVLADGGLAITTMRIPAGQEGTDYLARFEAVGGSIPYGWFLVSGALPAGLRLDATGIISGQPTAVGDFPITVRVVDAATPPAFAQRDFTLQVAIAPLRIVADQLLDLFVTRVVTLSNLTVIGGNALPYRAELQAAGGLRPYHWAELPLPENLRGFVPQSGLPDGLTLSDAGVIEGTVTDPSQVSELAIPFTEIVLRGYFFFAEVRDSQAVPEVQQAIIVVPVVSL